MSTATKVLQDLGLSENDAIRGFVMMAASQKLAEFVQECEALQHKYNMIFTEFEKKIQSQTEEIFMEEEDYMAWKFAEEGAAYWRERVQRLKIEQ